MKKELKMRTRRMWLLILTVTLTVWAGCKQNNASEPAGISPLNTPPPQNQPATTGGPSAAPSVSKVAARLPGHGAPFMDGTPIQMPVITWGPDFVWFYCTGGAGGTRKGTICDKYGVNVHLVPQNDYSAQLAAYRARKSPFLRNPIGTLGKYWEQDCRTDPQLCPRPWFFVSKSKGDYLYCRAHVKDVAGLAQCKNDDGTPRKCKIAVMKDGPWESFVVAVIHEDVKRPDGKNAEWSDVEIAWARDLSGTNSADMLLRNDPSVDCAMGITPDMMGATGGQTSVGTGGDNTVKGAHVVTGTFYRRDAGIIDGFAVSTEFATGNGQSLHAAIAAYEQAAEELRRLARAYNGGGGSAEYEAIMQAMVDVWPEELKGDLEEANGLFLDAEFLGIAGNRMFFDEKSNVGIAYHEKWANKTARLLGTAQGDVVFGPTPIDWNHAVFNDLASARAQQASPFGSEAMAEQLLSMSKAGTLGANVIVRFSARFEADDDQIKDCTAFHENFAELRTAAERHNAAPIAIRAHYDPSGLVSEIIMAGLRSGLIDQQGTKGNYSYYVRGEPLSLKNIGPWLTLLEDPQYQNGVDSAGQPFTAHIEQARAKSENRGKALTTCLTSYAKQVGWKLDPKRVHVEGVGMAEPLVAKGRSLEELAANRRAECTLVKVTGEALTPSMLEL